MLELHGIKTGSVIQVVLSPLFLINHGNAFKVIHQRHEQGGGHWPKGCSRDGTVAVALLLLVLVRPTWSLRFKTPQYGTPMVDFTGQVPNSSLGSDAFQEADIVGNSTMYEM